MYPWPPSSHFVDTYGISIFCIQWNTPLQKTKTQPFSDKSCDYILPHQSAQRWSTYRNLRGNSQQKLNKKNSEHLLVFSCKNQQCTKWTALHHLQLVSVVAHIGYMLLSCLIFFTCECSEVQTPLRFIPSFVVAHPPGHIHRNPPSSRNTSQWKLSPTVFHWLAAEDRFTFQKRRLSELASQGWRKKHIYPSENLSSTYIHGHSKCKA